MGKEILTAGTNPMLAEMMAGVRQIYSVVPAARAALVNLPARLFCDGGAWASSNRKRANDCSAASSAEWSKALSAGSAKALTD